MTKIIADFCANHLGDRRLIEHGIKLLAGIGVDIVKFQAFRADKLHENYPNYKENYDYYKSVELKDYDYAFILDKCKQYGIEPLFTAFDLESVDYIAALGLTSVKIASPDAEYYELISRCIDRFKTVYISAGMVAEGSLGLYLLKKEAFNNDGVKLLYCVSKYPTKISDIDFDTMSSYEYKGFSDHTLGTEASKRAIDMGLEVIEKHFTLGRDLPGRDQAMSTTLEEFKELVEHRNYKKNVANYKIRWRG